jgi:site-specific recombinase XerD
MSCNTICWYGQKLVGFLDFLRESGVRAVISALVPDVVRAFVALQQAEDLSPFTVLGYVQVVKGFATWLIEEGYLNRQPLWKLPLPRLPVNVIKPLDDAEAAAILGVLKPRCFGGSRALVLLLLLLDTGMRLGEAEGLTLDDAGEAIREGVLRVRGKGARERQLPVGRAARNALRRYLQVYRPTSPSDALFVAGNGRPVVAEGLRQIIRRAGRRAGVRGVHPHRLRHTFARKFLMSGGDALTLQRILGHSTLEMVRNYVSLDVRDVQRRHAASSPGDRFWLERGAARRATATWSGAAAIPPPPRPPCAGNRGRPSPRWSPEAGRWRRRSSRRSRYLSRP